MFARARLGLRRFPRLTSALLAVTLGCQGDPDTSDSGGAGGAGGDNSDLNDSTCGTSELVMPALVELELMEGERPKARGGKVRPGIYDLVAWRLWLDPQPGNIATSLRSTVLELGEIGTLRLWVRNQTSSSRQSGSYSTSGSNISFRYECPGITNAPATPYSASDDELVIYSEDGQEFVYARK